MSRTISAQQLTVGCGGTATVVLRIINASLMKRRDGSLLSLVARMFNNLFLSVSQKQKNNFQSIVNINSKMINFKQFTLTTQHEKITQMINDKSHTLELSHRTLIGSVFQSSTSMYVFSTTITDPRETRDIHCVCCINTYPRETRDIHCVLYIVYIICDTTTTIIIIII